MLPISTTRAQQARLYLRIRSGFGLSDQNPRTSVEAASAALAEAVSTHANGAEYTLAEIFTWAEKVLAFRDEVAGPSPAIYDLASLSEDVGSRELALLICKLCGAYIHHPSLWQDDGAGRPVAVTFPPNWSQR